MKNKKFMAMSQKEKESILYKALRQKTDGLLNSSEIIQILFVLSNKQQFRICVYNDINKLIAELKMVKSFDTIYGWDQVVLLKCNDALIASGFAVFVDAQKNIVADNCGDRLLIYIPNSRRCNYNCVSRNIICEHIEHYGPDLCCGLQRVQIKEKI